MFQLVLNDFKVKHLFNVIFIEYYFPEGNSDTQIRNGISNLTSDLKMETASFSQTLASTDKWTRRQNPGKP